MSNLEYIGTFCSGMLAGSLLVGIYLTKKKLDAEKAAFVEEPCEIMDDAPMRDIRIISRDEFEMGLTGADWQTMYVTADGAWTDELGDRVEHFPGMDILEPLMGYSVDTWYLYDPVSGIKYEIMRDARNNRTPEVNENENDE